MTDQNQSLRDDIAFLRDLAEAGRDRPMIGGSILLMVGSIFGVASLVVWYLASVRGLGGVMYSIVWGFAFVLYMAFLIPLLRRLPKTAGASQAAAGVAWSAVGLAIFVVFVSLWVLSYRLHIPNLMLVFPSILMGLYGASWFVAATLLRQRWLHLIAVASFGMALVNAWFASGHTVWLIYGVSLLALLAAPGFVLMRQGRTAA
ncbi:MAG: hypothetical protein KKE02_21840 [Alphaproteobacteria bacterium]|nr:hypothetical protein [Alphaproteobacteria bacterium]MBU1515986.1 hypothetical protein [Alphaproteobacteria bacterium]MBU2092799.1 hypothetical protein [Alphaproteobacteria bacterium]MBU2153676.1 hypothetical protein [Alphaproteobacteria bacterium]MBU2308304.1 hypothetical protein [Alphaproteobacteria bacterium]